MLFVFNPLVYSIMQAYGPDIYYWLLLSGQTARQPAERGVSWPGTSGEEYYCVCGGSRTADSVEKVIRNAATDRTPSRATTAAGSFCRTIPWHEDDASRKKTKGIMMNNVRLSEVISISSNSWSFRSLIPSRLPVTSLLMEKTCSRQQEPMRRTPDDLIEAVDRDERCLSVGAVTNVSAGSKPIVTYIVKGKLEEVCCC